MNNNYLFTSERLGFRNWKNTDANLLFEMNSDAAVMEFFPRKSTKKEAISFIDRMQTQYVKNGFCYFAVELLETTQFIGFIGLSEQHYKADFNPSIDIGWRLLQKYWHKGYATEGAKASLNLAFNGLILKKIIAVSPKINKGSIGVMKKIGMQKVSEFEHPLLLDNERLKECVLYQIKNT